MASKTRTTPRPARLQRLWQNVSRFPLRTARSLGRILTAAYRLERRAFQDIDDWLPAARLEELDAISGFSSGKECRLLAHLVRVAPGGGEIVEIGAWHGKSTAWLIEAAQSRDDRPTVTSIDPHLRDSWTTFQQTVQRFALEQRGLRIIRALSHDASQGWRSPISLLWIDGCHEYEAVAQDIADFVPHVVPGGWIVFDDAAGGHFPGVERAITEGMTAALRVEAIGTIRHLQLFRRLG